VKAAISPPFSRPNLPSHEATAGAALGTNRRKKPNPLRTKTLRTNPKTKPSENKTVGAVHLNRLGD